MSAMTRRRKDNGKIDLAASAAQWYEDLLYSSNRTFMPLYFDQHRYLVLMGGGGSGKSIFAGRKILERATSEPGHRLLVCRKVARTLRDSCFRQLIGQLAEYYPDSGYKINRTDMRITFPNGSEVLFSGLDDVEKLKSIYNITGIWIEEASELEEADFNQLDIRLRGKTRFYKQIILSFNPISALHWLKRRFFDSRDERALCHRSNYHDNRFLDQENIRTLEAFRETDPYYYAVYCLGEWGVYGQTVFPAAIVQGRLAELDPPKDTGIMEFSYDGISLKDAKFLRADDGWIKVYERPEAGVPYVIGVDTAGDGSDYNVAQVLDNRTGRQVATMRREHMDEDVFARQVMALGLWYNTALIGVETNFSTYPAIELERLRYPNQYVRETVDNYTHAVRPSYGVRTDSKSRPIMIAGLIAAVREDIGNFFDRETLEEMLTFVRDERGRPEAQDGAHDDCIMAIAIAHYIRPQQRYEKQVEREAVSRWTTDMWEDYEAATPEERQYLIKKWGYPKK